MYSRPRYTTSSRYRSSSEEPTEERFTGVDSPLAHDPRPSDGSSAWSGGWRVGDDDAQPTLRPGVPDDDRWQLPYDEGDPRNSYPYRGKWGNVGGGGYPGADGGRSLSNDGS